MSNLCKLIPLSMALSIALCFSAHGQNDGSAASHGPIVVLITIDGFPTRALNDQRLPMPTLRQLELNGAHADAMQPVNPTVTWPNHTSLITGVTPAEHHVVANGLITFPGPGAQPQIKQWVPKEDLVHARTLYDAAAEKGLTTGQVDWVAIYGARNVRWQFAERPTLDSAITKDLIAQNIITPGQIETFAQNSSPAWRDQIWTDAAIDILIRHTPNLLLFHLLQTDTLQHEYGPLTPAAYAAYAYADACLTRLVDAARTAGLLNRITFIIASDHGFASYTHLIRPNVGLIQQGLLTKHNGVYAGRVGIHTEDGSAFVFIHNATDRPALTSKLKAYFQRLPGVAAVYTNREALQLGLPSLSSTDQAADLFLAAKPGYAFIQDTVGPLAEKINPARGTHGYLNSDPDMQALFIASGAHIRHGIDVGSISNLRVAPTIAALLGISLPAAKQPSLKQALQ